MSFQSQESNILPDMVLDFNFQGFLWFFKQLTWNAQLSSSLVGIRIDNVDSHRWTLKWSLIHFLKSKIFYGGRIGIQILPSDNVDICWWHACTLFLLRIQIERHQMLFRCYHTDHSLFYLNPADQWSVTISCNKWQNWSDKNWSDPHTYASYQSSIFLYKSNHLQY